LLEKNQMKKKRAALNKKTRRNICRASSHSKLFQNNFLICDVCCNMNEESALEKLQQIAKETKAQKIAK
jgi:hypothetical protein